MASEHVSPGSTDFLSNAVCLLFLCGISALKPEHKSSKHKQHCFFGYIYTASLKIQIKTQLQHESPPLSLCHRWNEMTAALTTWRWVTTWPAAKLSTFPPWWSRLWMFTVLTSCCRTSGSTPRWLRQCWFRWRHGCPLQAFTCSWKQVMKPRQRVRYLKAN